MSDNSVYFLYKEYAILSTFLKMPLTSLIEIWAVYMGNKVKIQMNIESMIDTFFDHNLRSPNLNIAI